MCGEKAGLGCWSALEGDWDKGLCLGCFLCISLGLTSTMRLSQMPLQCGIPAKLQKGLLFQKVFQDNLSLLPPSLASGHHPPVCWHLAPFTMHPGASQAPSCCRICLLFVPRRSRPSSLTVKEIVPECPAYHQNGRCKPTVDALLTSFLF